MPLALKRASETRVRSWNPVTKAILGGSGDRTVSPRVDTEIKALNRTAAAKKEGTTIK